MKIEVTQEDIDNGRRNDCRNCPIARAVLRASNEHFVSVSGFDVMVGSQIGILPDRAQEFVAEFDACDPVVPFAFDLEVLP